MKTVSIIRGRGQLTIPESIRRAVSWITPQSPVSILVTKPDEIIIKPHKKEYDWDKIWEMVKKSRAIKGRGRGSTVEFLEKDRQAH